MTLQEQERELETLDQEADAIAVFVASLETWRLQMIGSVVDSELTLRYEGKPGDKCMLH